MFSEVSNLKELWIQMIFDHLTLVLSLVSSYQGFWPKLIHNMNNVTTKSFCPKTMSPTWAERQGSVQQMLWSSQSLGLSLLQSVRDHIKTEFETFVLFICLRVPGLNWTRWYVIQGTTTYLSHTTGLKPFLASFYSWSIVLWSKG